MSLTKTSTFNSFHCPPSPPSSYARTSLLSTTVTSAFPELHLFTTSSNSAKNHINFHHVFFVICRLIYKSVTIFEKFQCDIFKHHAFIINQNYNCCETSKVQFLRWAMQLSNCNTICLFSRAFSREITKEDAVFPAVLPATASCHTIEVLVSLISPSSSIMLHESHEKQQLFL